MAFGGGKWNSFREYIQSKNEKVKEQLSERAEVVSAIFEGCCFLINGKSDVTDAVLKRLLFAHGGKYDMYGGTHTHLVADNLAAGNQRWKQLRERQKFSRFQVVTSTWILDSVEAGKRLPESRYLPECLQISTRQQRELFPKAILKCTDPGFVQSYFKQSRLHLLGRWRSWLRQAYRFRAFESLADSSGLGRWSPHRKSIVLHVDFDAFFVNVALRSRPDLSGRPVGVAHGSGGGSNSELASVNYEARAYGVHNGQWVSSAKKLCPSLITVPYDFEGIKECSLQLFSILSEVTDRVLPASCDEAYLQLVDEGECAQAAYIASYVRDAVLKATRIAVSVGIGPNLLLAKLAGLQAKPVPRGVLDTACYLSENPTLLRVEGVSAAPPLVSSPVVQEGWRRLEALAEVDGAIPVELLDPWPAIRLWMRQWMLRDLPGVGARIEQQLREEGLVTCGDLQDRTTVAGLKMVVGEALGLKLSRFAEGHDPRPVPAPFHGMQEQITIQVNWGIRLTSEADFEIMLDQLAVEAAGRCHDDACVASAVSLRLLIRAEGAPMEPAKPLGCGLCDPRNSSSHKLAEPAAASESIRYALQICWREIQP
ncbi:MAG: uncharacterized protein KVP18_000418 [Porospora cf. gigantea A]|nr:MAG: hypothetical protein KVP18_000418 [Porospora cf. gigantea A]